MAHTKPTSENGATVAPTPSNDRVEFPSPQNGKIFNATPRGPPLWKIHELPAPIRTFPLPSFYPNNPLSLVHVAYVWLKQLVAPPREPSVVYEGVWSPSTRSVIIKDSKTVRALWEQGFYGKGHLSRSEPNWLKREQARKGAHSDHVAEVFTNKRREERTQMKWERAKKEQEAIQRTRFEESRVAPVGPRELLSLPNSQRELDVLIYGATLELDLTLADNALGTAEPFVAATSLPLSLAPENGHAQRPSTPKDNQVADAGDHADGHKPMKRRKSVRFSPKVESATFQLSDPPSPGQTMLVNGNGNGKTPDGILTGRITSVPEDESVVFQEPAAVDVSEDTSKLNDVLLDKEHLQLTLEEAFWLSFGLGVLQVKVENTDDVLSVDHLFQLAREYSSYPPRQLNMGSDDPFLIQYAVYHHFRSLGWVTRPGIKFGCDWLLYHRGPAFSHAEFAIVVLPSYSDSHWRAQGRDVTDQSWHWLHMVNRVQSTALKTLVLVYVDVPPPSSGAQDIPTLLKQYKIREVMVKRWLINRNRD